MSRVLKVSQGDYVLQVQSGGNIVLNTGVSTGTVTITGNLDVKGTTTTVESTDTTIKDNIIRLNFGQTGDGISGSLGYESGIDISRGSREAAQFLFYDSPTFEYYNDQASDLVVGAFRLGTRNIAGGFTLGGLQLRTLIGDGVADLGFDLQDSNSVLRVVNSTDYWAKVVAGDDNVIPNKRYISEYVSATGGVANVNNIHYDPVFTAYTGPLDAVLEATGVSLDATIAGTLKVQITSSGLSVDSKLILANNQVSTLGSNDLVLTSATGFVQANGILELVNKPATTTAISGSTKLYSQATEGAGRSGIYFVNDTDYGTNTYNADELVSKNRAVLLSILF